MRTGEEKERSKKQEAREKGERAALLDLFSASLSSFPLPLASCLLLLLLTACFDNSGKEGDAQKIPRFASLRVGDVNLRVGPGTRYPILWHYSRAGLPVEILNMFEDKNWHRIRDPDGEIGWVQISALSRKRTIMVMGGVQDLRASASIDAVPVAHLEAGTIGELQKCEPTWCKVKFEGIKGYLPKTAFWGLEDGE